MLRPLGDCVSAAIGGFNLARPGKDLARHKEGNELGSELTKTHTAVHQVVLMAAVCVAGRIRIILENRNPSKKSIGLHLSLCCNREPFNNPFTRFIMAYEVAHIIAFRRRIFGVATDILIKSSTIL